MGIDAVEDLAPSLSRLARTQPLVSRWVPAAAIFCFLAWCYVGVRSDFSWDDSEPEILNQAWRLANGSSIYNGIDTPPFVFASYPPLYFAATALLLKLTGLSYLPAKLLSFLAALSIGWAMVCLSREWNHSKTGGVWAAFFLFLIPAFLYNSARCQVQMAAVAFSIWSLVFFLRNRWKETLIISPLLALLAIYTKQTQIALPLAMIVYLAVRNRRWLLPYVSMLAIGGLLPFLWLQKATDGYFFINTVQLAKLSYDAWQIAPLFLHHAGPLMLFLGFALLMSWRRFTNGQWEAIDCYLACVFIITLITLGRIGAHGQYVLELLVATLLFLLRTNGLPAIRGRATLVSIQVLLLFLYTPAFIFIEEGLWDISANRAAGKIYSLIRSTSGPILSQQNSFSLFSRGEIYIQLFHFTGLSREGLWDQSSLLNEIDKRAFCCVITEFPIEQPIQSDNAVERFTPEMLKALQKNYHRHTETADPYYPYYLYTPRTID
jgi:hypothetical protein